MLEQARVFQGQGRAVYVIADSQAQATAFERELAGAPSIQVEVGAPSNFDWTRMDLRGAWPNCVVLVDHYVIERRFAPMLEELHRYDSPKEEAERDGIQPVHHPHRRVDISLLDGPPRD